MGRMGNFDLSELKKLQEQLNRVNEQEINDFLESCAKELAARLLHKVKKRTPVGNYSHEIMVTAKRDGKKHKKGERYTKKVNPSGKTGGTLRRAWTIKPVYWYDGYFVIEIVNPVEYASYVEFGHRTANHSGWVQGRFMMTISEQELSEIAPNVLKKKIEKFLGECFNK